MATKTTDPAQQDQTQRDPMTDLAMALLSATERANDRIVDTVKETSEFSIKAVNDLRMSTANEAQLDREANRKDSRQMMLLIALFGALIAALSGLNIMFDGGEAGSLTIEGTPTEAGP